MLFVALWRIGGYFTCCSGRNNKSPDLLREGSINRRSSRLATGGYSTGYLEGC